jgi:hypothetical protein
MSDVERFVAELIDRYFALAVFILGVSHLLQPRRGVEFFDELRKSRHAGFIIGMYTLPFGLLLVIAHNHWEFGWPLAVTIGGWMMTVKGVVCFWLPQAADRVRGMRAADAVLLVPGTKHSWLVCSKP